MNIDATTHLKKLHYTDQLTSLQAACKWMSIERDRAAQYQKLICEFFVKDKRSPKHILAYNESCEITDIHELWNVSIENFPGLNQKIRAVFNKGPILREDENPDTSSNRPRNDAFVYLLAGKLISAGLTVIAVDGIAAKGVRCYSFADISFDWKGLTINIECKRPQTLGAIVKRVREALQQLTNPNRQGQKGIIAIDCSAFIRPLERLLEANSAEQAENDLSKSLENTVVPKVKAYLKPAILGFLLFARAPAMIQTGHSSILSPHGNPIAYCRPYCICTWLEVNSNPSTPDALQSVSRLLHQSIHSNGKAERP